MEIVFSGLLMCEACSAAISQRFRGGGPRELRRCRCSGVISSTGEGKGFKPLTISAVRQWPLPDTVRAITVEQLVKALANRFLFREAKILVAGSVQLTSTPELLAEMMAGDRY